MVRILIAAWLSLLVVGMQQQFVVHEVDHLRAKVQRGHDASFVNPASAECLECALLSGGANAAPAADSALSHHVHAGTPVATIIAVGEAQDKPAFYQSRGPPPLV